jgi:hypothetical protein
MTAADPPADDHDAARSVARRERQLVEIVAAVINEAGARAAGLAAEHRQEFPGDAGLLDGLLRARSAPDRRC